MASIEVGRVCIKTAGREAGEKCAIVEIIDENFVEVIGEAVKNRMQIPLMFLVMQNLSKQL